MRFLRFIAWTSITLVPTPTFSQCLSHRKSLGFGPILPHGNFVTSPSPHLVNNESQFTSSNPFFVAQSFLGTLLKDLDKSHMSYIIRNDSYTDIRTGITHFYVKQIVDGFEVTNGLININVRDNRVMSYGDSFYRGRLPIENVTTASVYRAYCGILSKHLKESLHSPESLNFSEMSLPQLREVYNANCHFLTRNITMASYEPGDPRPAVLMFIIASNPCTSFAEKLASDFDRYLSEIIAVPLDISEYRFELNQIPGAIEAVPIHMAYTQISDGENRNYLKRVWKFEVRMKNNWYEVATDALDSSNIISVADWVSDSWSFSDTRLEQETAKYLVYKWGINDPQEGERSFEKEDINSQTSPLGWQVGNLPLDIASSTTSDTAGEYLFYTTVGNNIYAQQSWDTNQDWINSPRPTPGPSLDFNYPYEWNERLRNQPLQLARSFMDASITQLFYTLNKYHDFLYLYGFDEVSGNFQQINFGRGGQENDAVIANGQDGGDYNNANFLAPPDGRNGVITMFLWNTGNPYRDGDFEAGIVIHEYTHGLSTRLTGGPANSGCLDSGEASGMSEGWGDWFATTIRSKPGITDYIMAAWADNNPRGLRRYPYSLSKSTNPQTYKSLDNIYEVHAMGGVWAEMLWVVENKLVKKHGYATERFPPKLAPNGTMPPNNFYRPVDRGLKDGHILNVPNHGNTLMIQLVINGMKLQPCSPSFTQARDAIIQADKMLTGGENFCDLWEGFAERGLGIKAGLFVDSPYFFRTEDFTVPDNCKV